MQLADRDDFAGAQALLEYILCTRIETVGRAHPKALAAAHNLAMLWLLDGRIPRAEELLRETALVTEHALGAEHPATLCTLASLGAALIARAALDEAEELLGPVVLACSRHLRPDDAVAAHVQRVRAALLDARERPIREPPRGT